MPASQRLSAAHPAESRSEVGTPTHAPERGERLAAHQRAPLVQVGRPVDVVGPLDVRQRGARFDGIPVPRKDRRVTGQPGQLLQAAEHVVDVAAGEVGASAAVEEQGVAGDQASVEQEALAARSVAGGVQQLDLDVADGDLVAVLMGGQVAHRDAGDARNPQCLMGIDVHGHFGALEQLGQALEGEAHHGAADVVGVVVGDQHARQVHAVVLERVEQIAGGIGRVDHHGVAGLAITDEVGEVAHLLGHDVAGGEIPAGEQLAEVQTVRR